jgi:hypothetical protein
VAITIGQGGYANATLTSVTTSAVTTTNGSTFVLGKVGEGGVVTFTDNKSNTYTKVNGLLNLDFGAAESGYDLVGSGGSSHTFTGTQSSNIDISIFFVELLGVQSLDTSISQFDTTSPYTASITPTAGERFILAFFAGDSGSNPATHAESNGFTIIASTNKTDGSATSWPGCFAYKVVTADGSTAVSVSFTETGSTSAGIWLYAFVPAPTGPTINTQPQNQVAKTGSTASFSVSATASAGTLSYQWQLNTGSGWSNVSGATSSSYTTPTLTNSFDQYLYRVNVTDSNGTVSSDSAVLDVWEYVFDSAVFDSNVFDTGLTAAAVSAYVKISGVWKSATAFVKISGVWKAATPGVKVSGVWKN